VLTQKSDLLIVRIYNLKKTKRMATGLN